MTQEDAIFEDIRALSDDADEAGLFDVAMVLEFALDVFLRETGRSEASVEDDVALGVETPIPEPDAGDRMAWSMSTFPLAHATRKAS